MMYLPTQADLQFRHRVSAFLAIETKQTQDRPLRLGMVGAGVTLMLAYGMTPWLLLPLAVYFVSDLTYISHARRVSQKQHITRPMLGWLLAHHAITISAFIALPIISAFSPLFLGAWAAMVLTFGQALNCIGYDTRSVDATRIGVIIVGSGAQAVTFGVGLMSGYDDPSRIFLHMAAGLVTIYFARVALTTADDRARLSRRTEELAHAQKGEAVGRLTSGIAHDFNNLLTVMRGNIDLLPEVPEAERGPLLREIGAATDRGGKLVGQLLATSRRRPTDPEIVLLDEFFAGLITFARRVLPANVVLDVNSEPRLSLRTDPAQLEAALLNLIVNAKDAMPSGGIVSITAQRVSSGDQQTLGEIIITVTDDGPGMTPEVLRHATEAFVTTKPEGKGTGLGLAMVRTFAEQSGGRFELESAPGHGTTAKLRLRG
ncbi:Blue-light-activated protein [Jannaschia seosinensis]|uniref:histidine kinase n=1 Tax=Jannaschia seosinensis TaxID=313367 RepID=A0A0M7BGC4_9RHOB|nr:ATP-binding protein [Jannaschia seosinensis]CUH40904.1 Blue-light-activated protein [Jannaschia seosinensis]